MQLTHSIPGPAKPDAYQGRDLDCVNALRPVIAELAERKGEVLMGAMAGEISGEMEDVLAAAEASGWSRDEAEAAIARLAREYEGALGTIFD